MSARALMPPALVTAMILLGGCGSHFGRVEPQEGDLPENVRLPSAPDSVTRFEPARVRVHPLSRFEGAGDVRRAVVDVQVLDAYGHDVKWPGVVRVEVAASESLSGAESRWLDLTDGETNARAYDSISRCYPVRVPAPGTGVVFVRVRWLQNDGEGRAVALEATGQITPGK